jgi:hypothetical protein
MADYIVDIPVPIFERTVGTRPTEEVLVKDASFVTYKDGHVFFSRRPFNMNHFTELIAAFAPDRWAKVTEVPNGTPQ